MKNKRVLANYEETLYYDYDESHKGKILTKKEIDEEDYSRLDEYLKNYFIPGNIIYRSVDGTYSSESAYLWFSDILHYGFSKEEIYHAVDYIRSLGIDIVSRKSIQGATSLPDKESFIYRKMTVNKPLLPKEEQEKLFQDYKKSHNIEIRNYLLVNNMRLIYSTLKYFMQRNGIKATKFIAREIEDVGIDSLMFAIENYDIDSGVSFPTFASKVIYKGYLINFHYNIIKARLIPYFNEARLVVEERLGKKLSDDFTILDDILEYMQEQNVFLSQDLSRIKASIMRTLISYYETDKEETSNFEEESNRELDYQILITKIKKYLKTIKKKNIDRDLENLIICLGLDGKIPLTEREVADSSNIGRAAISLRIRNIERAILESEEKETMFSQELLDYYEAKRLKKVKGGK